MDEIFFGERKIPLNQFTCWVIWTGLLFLSVVGLSCFSKLSIESGERQLWKTDAILYEDDAFSSFRNSSSLSLFLSDSWTGDSWTGDSRTGDSWTEEVSWWLESGLIVMENVTAGSGISLATGENDSVSFNSMYSEMSGWTYSIRLYDHPFSPWSSKISSFSRII